jgi:SPP1 gp7 family putative phage head morphogenesis protein
VWRTSQGLLSWALLPLLHRWPRPIEDEGEAEEENQQALEPIAEMAEEEAELGADIMDAIGATFPITTAVTLLSIAEYIDFGDLLIGAYLDRDPAGSAMARTADITDNYVRRELGSHLAINFREQVPGLPLLIDDWIARNVNLIESGIRANTEAVRLKPLVSDVSAVIQRAYADGLRVEDLSRILQERYGVSNSRANLIARDQVLKLNGNINQHRQTAAGIEAYTWSTSRDERVRKSHQRLHRTRQQWISPPSVGHPGQDYQCRCVAIPVPPDWFEAD